MFKFDRFAVSADFEDDYRLRILFAASGRRAYQRAVSRSKVRKPWARAASRLDDQVERLSAAVGECGWCRTWPGRAEPCPQGPAEAGDLGDRVVRKRGDDAFGATPALGRTAGLVDRAELLVGVPGGGDLGPRVIGGQARFELGGLLPVEVFAVSPQQPADLVERVVVVVTPGQVSRWNLRRTSSTTVCATMACELSK